MQRKYFLLTILSVLIEKLLKKYGPLFYESYCTLHYNSIAF